MVEPFHSAVDGLTGTQISPPSGSPLIISIAKQVGTLGTEAVSVFLLFISVMLSACMEYNRLGLTPPRPGLSVFPDFPAWMAHSWCCHTRESPSAACFLTNDAMSRPQCLTIAKCCPSGSQPTNKSNFHKSHHRSSGWLCL